MKYLIFLFALAVGAQSGTPPASSNARTLGGKPPCSATITSNCISSAEYGAAAGAGDVLGAASVQSGRVPYGSGTASTITSSSKFAYNDTTGMGLIPPLSLGQNGTAAGRINFLGSTSGSLPMEADATAAKVTITGNLEVSGTITAGGTGANELTQIAAPSAPAAGKLAYYADSTSATFAVKNPAGVVSHTVQTKAAVTNQVVSAIADDGTVTTRALAAADIPSTLTSGTAITNAALTTPSIGAATGTSLLATGIVSGTAPIAINTGSDPCPTGTHCTFGTTYKNGYVFNQQTAATRVYIDLPTAAAGLQWCIKNSVVSGTGAAVTGIITVKAQSGDYINNDGTIGSSGGVLSSAGAAGDGACFVASAANHWEAFIGKGTWAP